MAPRKMRKSVSKKGDSMVVGSGAPPGGPIEIAFSFDTTGSMAGCIAEVRTKVQEVIDRLFSDIPGLRIAVFAHGDYCDKGTYITKWTDFSTDKKNLCDFVKNVQGTSGGDYEECYELVLRQAREKLSWSPATHKSLVMIGDAIPHPKNDSQNKMKIDWKEEVSQLSKMGVRIYSVQCGSGNQADEFWKHMADHTGGKRVELQQFDTIIDMVMSICYRETGADWFSAYEKEVRSREGDKIRSELNLMFDTLRDEVAGTSDSPGTTLSKKASLKRTATIPISDPPGASVLKKVKHGKVTKPKKTSLPKKKSSSVKAATSLVSKAKKTAASKVARDDEKKRILREKVTAKKFLPQLNWSNWYAAYQSDKPSRGREDDWSERRDGHTGVRHHSLFSHDTLNPAIYELAVQPKPGSRKCPVWATVTKGFNSVYWDTYLVRRGRIQQQMDAVVKDGSKVYLRRAVLKSPVTISIASSSGAAATRKESVNSVDELRSLIHQVYDYAWCVSGKKSHRKVVRSGVAVSHVKYH